MPVPQTAQDPGYHVLKLTATETQGRTVILTGLNPETGQPETLVADRDRDSLFILDDAAKATLPTQGIETVGVGALVATRDPKTGHTEYQRVLRTFPHLAGQTITAQFADVKTHRVVVTLTATPQHPFFVVGRGAVPLGRLGIGTQIVTRAGPPLVITQLVKRAYPHGIPVYNFEVQGDHTYFVGSADGGMWVHNGCTEEANRIIKKNGRGKIWNVNNNGRLFPPVNGKAYYFHDVVRDGDNIIDTMTYNGSEAPVPLDQWKQDFDILTGGNGNQFDLYMNFWPGSGEGLF